MLSEYVTQTVEEIEEEMRQDYLYTKIFEPEIHRKLEEIREQTDREIIRRSKEMCMKYNYS